MTVLKNKEWKSAIKTGLPVLYVENDKIIQFYKGKKKIIKRLKKIKIVLSKTFELI